jgi:FemAB-related protein (PEP-CTERM system-associated)
MRSAWTRGRQVFSDGTNRLQIEISSVGPEMQPHWDSYVMRHANATHCHRFAWKAVIENTFDLPTYYLMARQQGVVTGVLPLAWQKSLLFGSFITALPFLNAGGPLADSIEVEQALVERAIQIARENGAARLQLRYRGEYHLSLPVSAHKVAAVREISRDTEAMWKALNSNNRRKVNKATKTGMTADAEGAAALDIFYEIFADNMRNLGTPVYAKTLFSEVLRAFPQDTEIVVVRLQGKPIAAAFLIFFRDGVEATWMCSHWRYLSLQPNMLLYWTILRIAGERGFRWFDFGRSTRDSGTHKFKQLWDTSDVPLPWASWTKDGEAASELSPANPKFQFATWLWKKLPLPIANRIGPHIVRNLP